MPTLPINDLRKQLNQPLFAVAGAGEIALDYARAYVTETQDKLGKLEFEPSTLTREARQAQARFEARVAELQKDAAAFPGKVQVQLLAAITDLVRTYADLAARGEKFVAAIRKDGVKAATAVKDAPKHSTVVRRENQKVATARKPAARQTAKAADATARKAPATRKTTARKSTARKSTAAKKA
jgi:hypothetical protein